MADFSLTPSAAPPRREYVLLISGTMNPPHCGHIRLGLHAAQALAAAGHTVASICFVPVHDNYLLNKLALTAQQKAAAGSAPAPPSLCWPLAQRCEMLRALLREEDAPEAAVCEVLDYELTHGGALLEPDLPPLFILLPEALAPRPLREDVGARPRAEACHCIGVELEHRVLAAQMRRRLAALCPGADACYGAAPGDHALLLATPVHHKLERTAR